MCILVDDSLSVASFRADRAKSNFNTFRQRIPGIDHGLGQSDGFKARSHVQIKLEITISRWMQPLRGLLFEPVLCGFFRTNAFDDLPALAQSSGRCDNVFDLVATGEGTAVKKDDPLRILLKKLR